VKLIKLFISIILLTSFNLLAQIVIESDEIPHTIGTQWVKNSAIENINVNLGTTGGPQTWNFTSQPMGEENSTLTIVNPGSTPYIDSFPGSNLVYSSPSDSDTVYQYYNLNDDLLILLGLGGASATTPFLWRYDPSDSIPIPQSYGNSYSFRYGFIEEISTDSYYKNFHYGVNVYDAYGTVNTTYGNFECLRIRTYDTVTMTLYVASVPVLYDTTTFINYQFVAENYAAVVCVKSYPGETDPNYTEAYVLERLTSFMSGIKENGDPTLIECINNSPIFSDYTTIQYSLPEESYVELTLHDITGRTVKNLVRKTQRMGTYFYRWYGEGDNGKKLSSGIYFYKLKVGNKKYTDKVLLIR
jgi:hypothetical protein